MARDATSTPVVMVTVRAPGAAAAVIVTFAVACVALVTVVEFVVMPAPKPACVEPCRKLENWPVIATLRVWPRFPELGATVTRLAAGLIVRVAEFELANRVPVEVVPDMVTE